MTKPKLAKAIGKEENLDITYRREDGTICYQITSNRRENKFYLYTFDEKGEIQTVQENIGSPRPLQEVIFDAMPCMR